MLFLGVGQSLHGPLYVQNWFVIGHVVIFSFSQRVIASFTTLATFVSRDVTSFKSLWFTWISIGLFSPCSVEALGDC